MGKFCSKGLRRDGLDAGRVFRIFYKRASRIHPTWSFVDTEKKFAEESQDDCWITAALLMSTSESVPEGEKLPSPQRGRPGIASAPGTELSECMTRGGCVWHCYV